VIKWFAAALVIALLLLQYRLWFSGAGAGEMLRLRAAVGAQQADNERLSERNRQLAAEVRDLKQGYAALEERARTDLGMIGSNETFYQVRPADIRPAASGPGATPGESPALPRRSAPAAPGGAASDVPGGPGGAAESLPAQPPPARPRAATTLAQAAGK
jgi:cell division protein FtsB